MTSDESLTTDPSIAMIHRDARESLFVFLIAKALFMSALERCGVRLNHSTTLVKRQTGRRIA